MHRQMQLFEVIDCKSPGETYSCSIDGAQILPDGRLIVADGSNGSLKLFDKDNKLAKVLTMPPFPTDLRVVGDNEVAALLFCGHLQYVTIEGNDMRLGDRVDLGTLCTQFDYFHGTFITTRHRYRNVLRARSVKLHDMDGKTITTFVPEFINRPDSVAVNTRKMVAYFVVPKELSVECVTLDGKILTTYRNQALLWPKRIAVHLDGSVFVCDSIGKSVHHITSQCTHIETLLGDGLHAPATICFNPRGNRLYASNSHSGKWTRDKLLVYILEKQ